MAYEAKLPCGVPDDVPESVALVCSTWFIDIFVVPDPKNSDLFSLKSGETTPK